MGRRLDVLFVVRFPMAQDEDTQRADDISVEGQIIKVQDMSREIYVTGCEGGCSTCTSAYKSSQQPKIAESLVILGTIYSTTILAGDAKIGEFQTQRHVALSLIGSSQERWAVLSGQDFVAEPLGILMYAIFHHLTHYDDLCGTITGRIACFGS